MAARLALLLALWTAAVGVAAGCPELCSCQDKFAHQFADCAYKDMLEVPVGLPSNVTTVSLSANKIKLLKSQSFVNITQVTSLWLAHNEIVTVETDALAPLVQLRNLDVSYNKIVDFPWEDLRNLTALQLLKMNNNEMATLPKDAFSTLKDLRSLRINNNRFTSIAQGTFSALASMSHLQIYNNPFSCSCGLEWLRDWIVQTKISVPEPNAILCDAPERLRGTAVTQMPKLDCRAPTVSVRRRPGELLEGVAVTLACETAGNPEPRVSWDVIAGNQNFWFPLPTADDAEDAPGDDKTAGGRFLVYRNGSLVIPRLSRKEEGNYSCTAVNDFGRAEGAVRLVLPPAAAGKHDVVEKTRPFVSKAAEPDASKNSVIGDGKPDEATKSLGASGAKYRGVPEAGGGRGRGAAGGRGGSKDPAFASSCGVRDGSEYISNSAFNASLDDLKQYTFDFGVIALEVSETEAKVKLNPLQVPAVTSGLRTGKGGDAEIVEKEPLSSYRSASGKTKLDLIYLCVDTGGGHLLVEWSKIKEGVNSFHFHGLTPGTNYTLCLTYGGQDCQVQVVFTTRKKIPSLLIIVVVSIFLLGLATVPLLGATCCHLLYKYQGKTYKLIMKAQNPDQLEKQMTGDFDPRASFAGSEKTLNPSEMGEGEADDDAAGGGAGGDGDGEAEGSVAAESIPGSSSKTNPEEFEVGSEYSDRLPLGAEAVNISEEINGNYKPPSR